MKAIIKKVEFLKETEGKFGQQFGFKISYNDKSAFYTSKSRDQKKFVEGVDTEFNEEERLSTKGNKYLIVKPIYDQGGNSKFSRAIKVEQSKYSGFAMAYAKDLVVADKIPIESMYVEAQCMIDWMIEKDKEDKKGTK